MTMTVDGKDTMHERLILQSRMSNLAKVPPWIEGLAARHAIPDDMQFAMNLCLEEALSNIIRHGYSSEPDHSFTIQFSNPRETYFVFVVEDDAPPFNPVDSPELPAVSSLDETHVGGQGIRLMRQFADALEYEPTPTGNRLSIGFSTAKSAIAQG
jgi:anti-sigma regulatory factor (Ser/Thr protein kinase)